MAEAHSSVFDRLLDSIQKNIVFFLIFVINLIFVFIGISGSIVK